MENALGVPSCIAVELDIELDAYEDKKIVLMLGEEEDVGCIDENVNRYKEIEAANKSLRDTKEYWNSILRRVQVRTGRSQIDFMLNRMDNVSDNCV